MAGHNLMIKFQSGNQIEQITLSEDAVELLYPGNPAQTVEHARQAVQTMLSRSVDNANAQVLAGFKEDNITVQT